MGTRGDDVVNRERIDVPRDTDITADPLEVMYRSKLKRPNLPCPLCHTPPSDVRTGKDSSRGDDSSTSSTRQETCRTRDTDRCECGS